MGPNYEGALKRILKVTQTRGGLPITIRLAKLIATEAEEVGITTACLMAKGRRHPGVTDDAVDAFGEMLAKQAGLVEEPEPDPELEEGPGGQMEPEHDPVAVADLNFDELKALAKDMKIRGWGNMKRETLIEAIDGLSDEEFSGVT